MAYQQKKTILSISTGILVMAAYILYALDRVNAGAADLGDMKFWAGAMLVFIGIGAGITIVIQIVFHILLAVSIAARERESSGKEINKTLKASTVEDEMDKLIELKSLRVGYALAEIGVAASLLSLVLGSPPAVMLNILFLSLGIGSLAEGFVSLHYYKAGVNNG